MNKKLYFKYLVDGSMLCQNNKLIKYENLCKKYKNFCDIFMKYM